MPRETFHRELQDLQDEVLALGSMADKAIGRAVEALTMRHEMTARQVVDDDDLLDAKRAEIERQALLLITRQQPVATDLRVVAGAMTLASELERIGDYAEGIAKISLDLQGEPTLEPMVIIPRMAEKVRDMLNRSLDAYVTRDADVSRRIWAEDDQIDELYSQMYGELVALMAANPGSIEAATRLLWVSHNLERIADRVTNICENTIFIVEGTVSEIKVSVQ